MSNIIEITKLRKKAKSRIGFLSFILVIAIICFFLMSPIFSVDMIKVSGNLKVSSEEIISASGIYYGQNILKMDKRIAKNKILDIPYIKEANIKRSWPNQINLIVEEKEPIAKVTFYGSKLLLDEDGYILEVVTDRDIDKIVELEGISASGIKTGTKLECKEEENFKYYLEILKIFSNNDMLNDVEKLTVMDEKILIYLKEKNIANFGENTYNLEYKILLLKEIVLKETNPVYIDLSNINNIVTKPAWGMFETSENNTPVGSDIVEE